MSGRFSCRLVTLDEVYELAWELAQEIRASGFEPDLVVAIARGGFVPARLLCDFLGLYELTSLQLRHYAPGARRQEGVTLLSGPAVDVRDRRVLAVDDVNDSGATVAAVRRLLGRAEPAELRVAVLHEKASSAERADHAARREPEWQWILYQWAWMEDALGFLDRLDPAPTSPDEARAALEREYGLSLDPVHWKHVATLRRW